MTVMGKFPNKGNKFSKNQNKKIKHGKVEKKETTGKRGRLIVRNLPFKCNEDDLHNHFKSFGDIKDIQLLRRPDKKLVGCGFVEYVSRLSATKAAEQLNGKEFLGRPIYIEKAVSRDNYDETQSNVMRNEKNSDTYPNEEDEDDMEEDKDEKIVTSQVKEEDPSSDGEHDNGGKRKASKERKKKQENLTNLKKGRLIVRNLSFKTTEEKLKQHFSEFGEVTEVKLLRKPDNSLVGCGFVQFNKKLGAAKAIHHTSGKPFLGRPIIVDWAVAKDRFKQLQEEAVKKEIKKEEDSDEETKPIETVDVTIKEEKMSDKDSDDESDENSNSSDDEGNDDGDETSEDESDDDEEEDEKIKEEPEEIKYQRKEDVDEGKTVFVKNLPFSATDEEFKECMEKFGPTFYALVCKDKLTEHSKGSGFVKYKNKEDAEKCLAAGTELKLNGSILDPHPALKRSDIQNINDKSKDKKDNRNLYLVKEGMIVAGTPAAKGVSVGDMEKRLQLEQWKTTKLRNLNMLVSRNRLVIHNLPLGVADRQLRRIFQKHAGPTAVIREARVMRDLNQSDAKGRPVSKGYGFVAFEKHEDALKALRSINNNPSIFNPTQRPIVSFSIENKTVLNVKTKRQLKSQQRNPLSKDYKPDDDGGETVSKKNKKFKREINNSNKDQPQPEYAGMAATPGATVKMRKKFKLQDQAQKHLKDVKKQKQQMKLSRKMRRKEHLQKQKVEKVSSKKKKTLEKDETFSKLVDKYKSKLLSQTNKKKWYE
ncbi:RNA-binding protein 28-like [Macrosteles quadrilineatus]|uniref:RNA-binding protein 28-like n=1 Tax=Macrosteles quadrilineatus TaxID=74068 RepID=UPI0023E1696D|nr:RNA-binding protein 28-like [Macrosteles quadrilineatus]